MRSGRVDASRMETDAVGGVRWRNRSLQLCLPMGCRASVASEKPTDLRWMQMINAAGQLAKQRWIVWLGYTLEGLVGGLRTDGEECRIWWWCNAVSLCCQFCFCTRARTGVYYRIVQLNGAMELPKCLLEFSSPPDAAARCFHLPFVVHPAFAHTFSATSPSHSEMTACAHRSDLSCWRLTAGISTSRIQLDASSRFPHADAGGVATTAGHMRISSLPSSALPLFPSDSGVRGADDRCW